MRELKEEAKRMHEKKLESYGCGGKARAHGGRAEHDDEREDKKLIKEEVKSSALKHRESGGQVDGGLAVSTKKLAIGGMAGPPAMGRKRGKPSGGKGGKTNVNVIIPPGKGGDGLPPMGAGPGGPGLPPPRPPMLAMPPKPPMVAGPPPGGPAGPMPVKKGGKVEKHHEHEHKKKKHH